MNWLAYLEAREARLRILPEAWLQAVGACGEGSMEAFLRCPGSDAITPADLRSVARWRRELDRWQVAIERGFPPLAPEELLAEISTFDELAALSRVEKLLAMTSGQVSLDAWRAGLRIWKGAAGIARKEALWQCRVLDSEHPRYGHYGDLLQRKESLEELPGHRWLAALQGESEGVLAHQWSLPVAAMERQVALYRSDLGAAAEGRSEASLLEELVLDALPGALARWATEMATEQAVEAATTSYRELLLQTPPSLTVVAAVYVGAAQGRAAVAWLDGHGEPLDTQAFAPHEQGQALAQKLKRALLTADRPKAEAVVLPLRAADRGSLQEMAQLLQGTWPLHRVREAGLSAAREMWIERGHSRPCASAICIGQRLLQPLEAWGRLDPLSLGLAEYQEHLDATRLREALCDEKALVEAQRVKPTASHQSLQSKPQLNPMVDAIEALKPGMSLRGIVANITDFGAFVHVGLPEEGLVHKSELADRFVAHPSEVVRVGQEVTVRVLSTDLDRRRISLSMRSAMRPRPRSSGQKKAAALRDLENLFKK